MGMHIRLSLIHIYIKERLLENKAYGEYEFTFEDNGIGMTEDFQKVMFDPFTRAEDSRISKVTGTGLGMTITPVSYTHLPSRECGLKSTSFPSVLGLA